MAQDGRKRARGVHQGTTLESPLAATWRPRVPEKAVLVGVGRGIEESDLDELAALADSAGAEPVARVLQTRQDPNPATFVGRGKLEEIHRAVHTTGAGAVLLEPTEDESIGLLASELGMDGSVGHILEVPVDGTVGGPHQPDPRESGIAMEGQEVFRRAG